MTDSRKLQFSVIALVIVTCGLAITKWAMDAPFAHLSSYDVFPLFGLLAFSLMWTHYVSGTFQRIFHQPDGALRTYFTITAGLVLGLILLHPGLLWWQLWRDGLGLPPLSYLNLYIDTGSRIAVVLGSISLAIFLSFELKRKFGQATWWKYIEYLNVGAMFAIIYHALILGGDIRGWFAGVWIGYGLILISTIIYNKSYDKRREVS